MTITNTIIKKQNESNPLISVVSMESICNYESKHTNTENNNNKRDETLTCIYVIKDQCLQKNRKIVIKSDSNKSKRDQISNATDKDTKEKELDTFNYNIKVYISRSLVRLNLSALNSIKQKLTLSPVRSMLDPAKHNL